jgi:hypothetical protein
VSFPTSGTRGQVRADTKHVGYVVHMTNTDTSQLFLTVDLVNLDITILHLSKQLL